MTAAEYIALKQAVIDAGFSGDIDWSESCRPPTDATVFAREAIFVICNSGMKYTVAVGIFQRIMAALEAGDDPSGVFGHRLKVRAIRHIWDNRQCLFEQYMTLATDAERLQFCRNLDHIGNITCYHLAKNFGADVAKPDRHLQRMADAEGCTAQELCERIAGATGDRIATVDVVLWRAAAIGLIDTLSLETAAP